MGGNAPHASPGLGGRSRSPLNALGMVKFQLVDTSAEALMIVILTLWGAGLLYL